MVGSVVSGFDVHRRKLIFTSLFLVVLFVSLFSYTLVDAEASSLKDVVHVSSETKRRAAVSNAKSGTQVTIALDNDITLTEGALNIPLNKDIILTSNNKNEFYQLIGTLKDDPYYAATILVDDGGVLRLDGIVVTRAKGIDGRG